MLDKLLNDIMAYIDFLKTQGLFITIHGSIGDYLYKLSKYNLHDNPFCIFVKSDDTAWKRCIASQSNVFYACGRKPFWGMCWAGLEEYIFPVWDSQKPIAFVSVSGYALSQAKAEKRIRRVAKEFFLDKDTLLNIYKNRLKHEKPKDEPLCTLVNPLCQMLVLLHMLHPSANGISISSSHDIINTAVAYIERNYMKTLRLSDIARHCSCSVSTLCHVFQNDCGKSVRAFIISIRLQNARKLLSSSTLPISQIAALCGFSDPNYFSAVFKTNVGCSPSQYRKHSLG